MIFLSSLFIQVQLQGPSVVSIASGVTKADKIGEGWEVQFTYSTFFFWGIDGWNLTDSG